MAYPQESSFEVWFNDNAPDFMLLGKTLRAVEGRSYFDNLGDSIRNDIVFRLLPSLALIAALFLIKRIEKRAQR